MSKQKAMHANSFVGEIFQFGLYKPTQGRITRQVTCASSWVVVLLAAYELYQTLYKAGEWQYIAPFALLVIGFWAAYRVVNYAKFADFLIAVEAEMNKVSWPSWAELVRSSLVVIFVIFFLAMILFGYDLLWQVAFKAIGVLQ
jgi:preprotein translocase subunit SecE